MPRVRFLADFDYKPTSQVTIAYLAGMELTVKRECAGQAIAAGKAQLIRNPRKPEPVDQSCLSASAASSTA